MIAFHLHSGSHPASSRRSIKVIFRTTAICLTASAWAGEALYNGIALRDA